MIPRPEDCNWNDTRPWSLWERTLSRTLAGALLRCPDRDVPSLPRGTEARSVPTNAHRMLITRAEATND